MLFCECDEDEIVKALDVRERDQFALNDDLRAAEAAAEMVTVTVQEFTAVAEDGAGALLGSEDAALIHEDGGVMMYGDGGAGKTTLAIDLGIHQTAGDDWLGIPVPRPARVLLIENEGPRPLFRKNVRRKLEAWTGRDIGDRLRVFDRPWGEFTLGTGEWRDELALAVTAHKVDMVIAGPLRHRGPALSTAKPIGIWPFSWSATPTTAHSATSLWLAPLPSGPWRAGGPRR